MHTYILSIKKFSVKASCTHIHTYAFVYIDTYICITYIYTSKIIEFHNIKNFLHVVSPLVKNSINYPNPIKR